jgi:hypothetical protein
MGEELVFGENEDFPLMKHYRIQYKKKDIFKVPLCVGRSKKIKQFIFGLLFTSYT